MARPASQSADAQIASKPRAFAVLLLFVLPTGLVSGVSTAKKEELRTAWERAMNGWAEVIVDAGSVKMVVVFTKRIVFAGNAEIGGPARI